ncbi:histidine kinase [Kribbella hippodromi]|uniref:histidine kinase n=1 Tax=Kribbella hippodromi TaxID=434347 RepID=A0ABP4PZE4_9ACTN
MGRILVVLEVVALVGFNGDEAVRRLVLRDQVTPGGVVFFGTGVVISALVLLRRRYPGAIGELIASAFALSLICSVAGFFVKPAAPFGGDAETLALAVLIGAGCHRLRSVPAAVVVIVGGLAIVTAPMLRYGRNSTTLTLAVLWTILWGCSVAIGLMLRDADARREAALVAARNRERLALARELHDLVAHHITGVVVRTQAAQVVLAEGPEQELLREIEGAGAEALAAVRRLVTMLRSPEQTVPLTSGGLVGAVQSAVDGHANVDLRLAPGLEELPVAPETVSTVHGVVLESLTNACKHAPDARKVTVAVEPTVRQGKVLLRVEVWNDGLRPGRTRRSAGGYGLIGMGERIDALGGTLTAGEADDDEERGWRVLAELPLPGGVAAESDKGTKP